MACSGSIDELGISKDIARWTTNFTPPTQAYTQDANTALLLPFDSLPDRIDAAKALNIDFSDSHTPVPYGDVQIDITKSVSGGASARFDGSGDYLTLPDSDDWNFGTGNFTIDSWVKVISLPNNGQAYALLDQRQDSSNYQTFYIVRNDTNDTAQITYNFVTAGSQNFLSSQWLSWQLNAWYHIALVRDGDMFTIYRDGVNIGTASLSAPVMNYSASVEIGRYGGVTYANWHLDEYRISKGVARWTSNFTPPASAYETDENTSLLLHFDGETGSRNFPLFS